MQVAVITWNRLPEYFSSGEEPKQFKISISKQGTSNPPVGTTGFNWKFKALELKSTYCVSVMAHNAFGNGPWSDCVNFTTPSGI